MLQCGTLVHQLVHHEEPNEEQDKGIGRSQTQIAMEVVRQEREASVLPLHFAHREVRYKKTTQKEEAVDREKGIANGLKGKPRENIFDINSVVRTI